MSRFTSNRPRRFAPFAQPGSKLVTRALRAFPSAEVFLRCLTTTIVAISDEAFKEDDTIGFLDENTRAIFGRSYAAEPEILIEELKQDTAIAEADTLLLTIPNQLGVAYNAHVMEAILTTVAPALGWR